LALHIESTVTILKSEYDFLISELKSLREEIHFLKNGRNSKNSHTSPSHDIGRSNTKSLRVKGVKKTGGQIGHEGNTLLMSQIPDKIIDYVEINYCSQCANDLAESTLEFVSKRQEIILPPIVPQYVEHRCYRKICTCCGHQNQSEFPKHLTSSIQYGKCVEGLIAYMYTYQFLSTNRMANFMSNVFQMPISEGTIDNMLTRFAKKITPIYNTIQKRIIESSVIGSDETGSKIEAKKGWFHVWQTSKLTFIVASMSRGFGTVEKYFNDGFPLATLVSDCWAGQLKTIAKQHQLCVAHLLRELNNFIDALDDDWSKELKRLLEQAIAIKKESQTSGLSIHEGKIHAIKQELDKLLKVPDTPKHKKINAFIKRLCKYQSSILVFLENEDVPFDNNASERAVRNIKVKTKISGCFRTFNGAERFAKIRSVIDTTIKNSQNVFEALILMAKFETE
jgi:transposase